MKLAKARRKQPSDKFVDALESRYRRYTKAELISELIYTKFELKRERENGCAPHASRAGNFSI